MRNGLVFPALALLALLAAGCPPTAPVTNAKPKIPAPHAPIAKKADPGVSRAAPPQLETVPWPGQGDLLGVAALTSNAALAVGVQGAAWIDHGSVRVAPFPDGIADAVWADGPNFAIAVGYGGIAHVWNGKTWTASPTNTDADLHAVWGRGAGKSRQIFAGGSQGTILSFADGTWTKMKAPDDVVVAAFTGVGSKIWAVGQLAGEGSQGAILTLDGDSWVDACRDLACGGAIYSAWAPDESTLWTAGAGGELVRYSNGSPELLRTGTRAALTALWGTGTSDLFVGGDAGFCLHWDGKTWLPLSAGEEDLRSMAGLPSGEAWIVGSTGAIRHIARPVPGS